MESLKQVEKEIRILGYYQLIGGIIGIGTIALSFIAIERIIFLVIMVLPFLLSIYAGTQCLRNKSNKLFISKINQTLQVISFSLGGFGFSYCAGVYLGIGIDTTNDFIFKFNFGLSTINFTINSLSETSFILTNLVAFYLVYRIGRYEDFLDDIKEKMEKEKLDIEDHLISNE